MRSSTIIAAVFVFISTALPLPLTTHIGSNPSTPVAERRWSPLLLLSRAPTPKPFDLARIKSSPDGHDKGLKFRAGSENPILKSIWGRAAQTDPTAIDLSATTTTEYPTESSGAATTTTGYSTDGSGGDTAEMETASEEAPPPADEPFFDDADEHALSLVRPPNANTGLKWGTNADNKAFQSAQY
ncbi:MAG: hypothetical protein Q9172_000248 [Xanthocarpia lactea]